VLQNYSAKKNKEKTTLKQRNRQILDFAASQVNDQVQVVRFMFLAFI